MAFVDVDRVQLYYRFDGQVEMPGLVLVNSLGTDLRIWDDLVEELESEFHILRFDKRGHGLSASPAGEYRICDFSDDLAALLAQLQLDRVLLFGISIGGVIAIDFALSHPEMLTGLVLADTAARIGSAESWSQRISDLQARGLEDMAPDILPRWFAPDYAQRQPIQYQGYLRMLQRMPQQGYIASCAALRDADYSAEISQLSLPTLVLAGAQDQATSPELCRELARQIPNACYAGIEGAGHLPCIEQPLEVAQQLRQFAGSLT